jgi:OOP family OmpA-OmpF porin
MKPSLTLLALAAAFALPAFADDLYAGADLGQSKLEADMGNGYTASKHETSWSVFTGYQFHSNFAAELGYRDMGKISSSYGAYGGSLQAQAVQLSVLGKLPLNEQVDVYGRLGLGSIRAKSEIHAPGMSGSESTTKTKALVGIGAHYAITKEIGLRAEYAQFAKIDDIKLSTLTIGADYRF